MFPYTLDLNLCFTEVNRRKKKQNICFLIGVKTMGRYGRKRWRHMKEINWLVKDGVT